MAIKFSQNNEILKGIEQTEIERKFIALDSSVLDHYRRSASRITQLYLSHPDDEYSLRLRKSVAPDGEISFVATLKDRGTVTPEGLVRMEIETPISEAAFDHYSQDDYPHLHKERAQLCEGVTIDWIDGSDTPIIEVENAALNESAAQFLSIFSEDLIERTGHSDVDNESLAYAIYEGSPERPPEVSADQIVEDILAYRSIGTQQLVVGIGGRSGSGKSTLARELQDAIAAHPDLGDHADGWCQPRIITLARSISAAPRVHRGPTGRMPGYTTPPCLPKILLLGVKASQSSSVSSILPPKNQCLVSHYPTVLS